MTLVSSPSASIRRGMGVNELLPASTGPRKTTATPMSAAPWLLDTVTVRCSVAGTAGAASSAAYRSPARGPSTVS